jgi:hypothetical protein
LNACKLLGRKLVEYTTIIKKGLINTGH